MIKNIVKYVVSLGIAFGLLYWTLKDYNFAENIEKLKTANFTWFYLSAVFTIIAHTSRAIRSKMLLEPLGYRPSTLNASLAVFLGYFANYLVPRLGEVTRCTTLTNTENIPFESNKFDAITVAYGVRNFENLEQGLTEMQRVLKPNGKLVVLEFSKPQMFPFKQLFNFYFKNILPTIGKLTSKDSRAYAYLYESVQSFPDGTDFLNVLAKTGFKNTQCTSLTLGICAIYTAFKK